MRTIGHFTGGKSVSGASGRTGGVYDLNTGDVKAKVTLAASAQRLNVPFKCREGAAAMGGHQSATH